MWESERNQGPESFLPSNTDKVAVDALQVEHDGGADGKGENGQGGNQQDPDL